MHPRHFWTSFVLVTSLGAGLAPASSAQALADVARQEEARRKAAQDSAKEPPKVYTNKDLPGGAPAPPPVADAVKPAEPDKAKTDDKDKDKAKDAEPPKDEKYWSTRIGALRMQLDRDQTFADALQSRINALSADFVNRDDPAQRAVIERDRQKAVSELDRLKKQIDTDKKAIGDLEEEARRAGVPPGWLRS